MIFIAHRGNIAGPDFENENDLDFLLNAINEGYHVEVDVRVWRNSLWTGHDDVQSKLSLGNIYDLQKKAWFHCKNVEALEYMAMLKRRIHTLRFFWHQQDDVALVSNGVFWVYPDKKLLKNSIAVLPELASYSLAELKRCVGICSDVPSYYKGLI